ncbi:zinc-ribbon domain-containing protein [Candidatus Bathyarchaeota archaeon]|nr:zinc-ribbon domain-containing protein [Candidatus Bathyarchaeota archaeon]
MWMIGYPQWRNEALQAFIHRAKTRARAILHCPRCGTRNKLKAVFCKECGRKLLSTKDV